MTRLTAKKGMTEYKKGHGKEDYDYAWLKDIYYDDKTPLSSVLDVLKENIDKHIESELKLRDDRLNDIEKEVSKLRKGLEETLKGLITR